MVETPTDALLDQAPLSPGEVRELEGLLGAVLGTGNDIVLVQSEAILALEAVARSVAGPGIRVVNVVTGPYGGGFGGWMRSAGADVRDVVFPADQVADPAAVTNAIEARRPQVVSLVHAEAATGGTNPVPEILAAASSVGAITVLDSVAAIGAEPVPVDRWGVDLVVVGGQKALAGPAGVSAVSVSARAWSHIDGNAAAPSGSALSLTDWREAWLRTDRGTVPGLPNWLESRALAAAIRRVLAEGLPAVNRRHEAAAAAARAGIRAAGLDLWQRGDGSAPIATTVRLPDRSADSMESRILDDVPDGLVTGGAGALRGALLRINHYGHAADLAAVRRAVVAIASWLGADAESGDLAAQAAWRALLG